MKPGNWWRLSFATKNPKNEPTIRRYNTDHDRSNQAVERTEQPVPLGLSNGPRVAGVFRNDRPGGDGDRRPAPSELPLVLGGISPIDAHFHSRSKETDCWIIWTRSRSRFPLDWNHWQINDWPKKLHEIRAVTDLPIWVTEVGVSTFGADEVQVFGLKRTAELLLGKAERIFWYSLSDLPPPGKPPRGTKRARVARITGTFIWDLFAPTAHRSRDEAFQSRIRDLPMVPL